MVNINLLPDIKSEEKKKAKYLKLANTIAGVLAMIVVVAAIIIFYLNTVTTNNLKKIEAEITTQEKLIDKEIETETVLSGVKSHLGSISEVLDDRKKYSIFLTNFSEYVPQQIQISDLTMNADNEVVINGEAPTYEKLAGFVLILSGDEESSSDSTEEDQLYTNVRINSVSRNEIQGTVRFSVSFTAEEGAFNEQD